MGRRATSAGTGSPIDRRVLRTVAGILTLYPLLAPDLRRAERHLHAGGDSVLAEMMELGRLGRGGQRQVRGVADRPPGVAHGGGDLYLSTPEQKCIGWPEQKYISDLARRPPNWGPFRQASSLRGINRRVIGAGRV